MGRGLSSKYNSPEAVEETSTRNADDNEEGADNKEGAVNEEDANNEDRVDKKESNNIGSARDGEKKKGEGVKMKKRWQVGVRAHSRIEHCLKQGVIAPNHEGQPDRIYKERRR